MTSPGYSDAFGNAIQAGLGVPRSLWARNARFLNAWNNAETAHSQSAFRWNPWGNTRTTPGSHGGGSQGNIQSYPSFAAGVAANVATLRQANMRPIVAALKDPSTTQASFGQAVAASSWNPGGGVRYAELIGGARTSNPQGDVGAPGRAQSAAPGSAAAPPSSGDGCRFAWHIPLTPFGQSWDPCGDVLVGGLALTGGALLMLAGVAVTVAALRDTGGGNATGKALSAASAVIPAGKAAAAVRALAPAARKERAQTRAAAEAKRTAPARAEQRRDELHQARLRRAETAAVTRRRSSVEGPNSGRSTASIVAANRARNAARDRAAREPAPF